MSVATAVPARRMAFMLGIVLQLVVTGCTPLLDGRPPGTATEGDASTGQSTDTNCVQDCHGQSADCRAACTQPGCKDQCQLSHDECQSRCK